VNWKMAQKIGSIFYITIYLLSMVIPRKIPKDQLEADNFLIRFLQEILYLSGTLEVIGNFLLLFPLFFILVYLLGKSKSILSVTICILLSAGAELLQNAIPGRVSSLRDFLLNSLGAVSALVIYQIYLKKASQEKISK
jgi:glycopeptide antibiotics resistance protein